MTINTLSALVNIVLDWLFIFPLDMGIKGAAYCHFHLPERSGMVLVAWYFWGHSNQLRLYCPKFSQTALHLTARNWWVHAPPGLPYIYCRDRHLLYDHHGQLYVYRTTSRGRRVALAS